MTPPRGPATSTTGTGSSPFSLVKDVARLHFLIEGVIFVEPGSTLPKKFLHRESGEFSRKKGQKLEDQRFSILTSPASFGYEILGYLHLLASAIGSEHDTLVSSDKHKQALIKYTMSVVILQIIRSLPVTVGIQIDSHRLLITIFK